MWGFILHHEGGAGATGSSKGLAAQESSEEQVARGGGCVQG